MNGLVYPSPANESHERRLNHTCISIEADLADELPYYNASARVASTQSLRYVGTYLG